MIPKKWIDFIIFVGIILTFFINVNTLKYGHNLGFDFSQYIIHARNILEGKPYTHGISLEDYLVFPPGFPFLLVPLLKIFGLHFLALKIWNIVFWYLTIWLVFLYLRKKTDISLALVGAMMLATSPYFFIYKQNILSDIPFMFFAFWAIYLAEREKNFTQFIVFLIVASYALLIRNAGIALFAAGFLFYGFLQKDWKRAWLTAAVSVVLVLLIKLVFQEKHIWFYGIRDYPIVAWQGIVNNSSVVWRSLMFLIIPPYSLFPEFLNNFLDPFLKFLSFFVYVLLGGIFFFHTLKRELSFLGCFTIVYIGIVCFMSSYRIDPSNYTRLVLPLFPAVVIYGVIFYQRILKTSGKAGDLKSFCAKVIRLSIIVLILLNVLNIRRVYLYNDDDLFNEETQMMFLWIRENTKEEDKFMFWTYPTLTLMTGRIGVPPSIGFIKGEQNFPERIIRFKIDYVILTKSYDRQLVDFLLTQEVAKVAWENKDFKIFKITKLN